MPFRFIELDLACRLILTTFSTTHPYFPSVESHPSVLQVSRFAKTMPHRLCVAIYLIGDEMKTFLNLKKEMDDAGYVHFMRSQLMPR